MNITSLFRLLITVMILAGIPLTANACKCGYPEPDEYVASIDLIFKGKVLSITSEGKHIGGMRAKFKMLTSYKGVERQTIEVNYVPDSGSSCGWHFKENEEVTVFAVGDSTQGFKTHLCVMIPYANAMAHHDMKFQSAIEAYRAKRSALLKPPVTVKRLREQAAFFTEHLDYEDAEAVFNKLLAKQPKDIDALINRANIRYGLKRYEQALADYRTVLNLDAKHQAARHGKILTLLKLGRMNELEAQDRDFSGYNNLHDESKLSFAGLDLTGANFSHAQFSNTDFSGANLTNADFSKVNTLKCNFTNAKLSQAKFHKGYLHGARFDNAVLDNADFSNADMEGVFFDKVSSMQGTKFVGTRFAEAKLKGVKFDGYDLSNADFRGADLRNASFSNSQLNGATFSSRNNTSDLRGADLSAAHLTGVKWDGLIVIDCRTKFPKDYDITHIPFVSSWSGCEGVAPKSNLVNVHRWIFNIDAPNSNFSDLNLSNLDFGSGHFDGSNFLNSTLKSVVFGYSSYQNSNFENAKLNDVRLYNVNFSGASFVHAELSNVSLKEVDFTNANFDGAVMANVMFDEKTKWPSGFDPLAAGAKKDK